MDYGWSKKGCEISIAVEDQPATAQEDYLLENETQHRSGVAAYDEISHRKAGLNGIRNDQGQNEDIFD